jgi:hypothetical protein
MAYVIAAMLVLAGLDMIASLLRQAAMATRRRDGSAPASPCVDVRLPHLRAARSRHLVVDARPRREPLGTLVVRCDRVDAAPASRLIPSFGVIDITPIVAYFALQLLQFLVETILLAACAEAAWIAASGREGDGGRVAVHVQPRASRSEIIGSTARP